jgi:putative ABC transport system permease protein
MLRSWIVRLRNRVRRDVVERELDQEVQSYVELLTDEKRAAGFSEDAAHRAARIEVGGVEQVKDTVRDHRAGIGLENVLQDVRHGLRMAIRNPSFALIVVLTLGVGIGATTVVFSVVDAVLLNPLPFPRPNRIVTLWQLNRSAAAEPEDISPANFLEWRDRTKAFDAMAAIEPSGLDVVSEGEPQSLRIWRVSEGFFEILGVQPLHGRTFTSNEYRPGAGNAVVLSHSFWRDRFGGDTAVVGRAITFSGRPYVVAGIMPPDFDFPPGRDLWAPRSFTEKDRQNRVANYLNVIALLKPGVSVESADAELVGLADQLSREYPRSNANVSAVVIPLRDRLVGHVQPYLVLLMGAVAFVLLITCVNVANVILARGASRTSELAVRAALGAGRKRLFSQLLVENLGMALAGGLLGVVLARWGLRALIAIAPSDVPRIQEAGINATVLGFAIVLSCATAMLFGLLPARQFSKVKAAASLREGPRGSGYSVTDRTRRSLVIAEVALAVTLLTGASLLAKSFVNLLRIDPGFSPENVVALPVFVYAQYPTEPQRAVFIQETVAKIEAVSGVVAAGAASTIPFSEVLGDARTRLSIERRPLPAESEPTIGLNVTTPGYFQAMGIAVARGRGFTGTDLSSTQPVAIINESMAKRFWPTENPLGERIRITDGPPVSREIVGVVKDTRDNGLDSTPQPTVFLPHHQYATGGMTYVVKTSGNPAGSLSSIKSAVWAVNKQLPFRRVIVLRELVATSIAPRQFVMVVMGAFGLVGLFLAGVGLFGIVTYLVARRTQEIGLRIALGATPHGMIRSLVADGIRLAVVGAAFGLVGALALMQVVSGFLFEVQPTDPIAFTIAIVVVLIVAGVASYLPARRAASLSPMHALRVQ